MSESEKLKFLESFLGSYKFSNNTKEAEFFCPFCLHHKRKLSINIETDSFQCWKCNKGGKSLFPILKQKKASASHLDKYVKKFKAKNVHVKKDLAKDFVLNLPEEYHPLIGSGNSLFAKRAYKYMREVRNISDELILKHKIGFCSSGDFANRIIIPSFDKNGNLNFFTSRDIEPNSLMPYVNAKNLPHGYKNTIIINELNVDLKKPVVIVEGYFDLFSSIDNTIALCGSTLNPDSYLFKTLVENNTEVRLALDPDAYYKKTIPISEMFMNYDINVYNVDVRPYKDMGKMTREQALERIQSAKLVTWEDIFKAKINRNL